MYKIRNTENVNRYLVVTDQENDLDKFQLGLNSKLNKIKKKECRFQRVIRRESKTDSYSKDLLFLACVAFCVITFEPIMI